MIVWGSPTNAQVIASLLNRYGLMVLLVFFPAVFDISYKIQVIYLLYMHL